VSYRFIERLPVGCLLCCIACASATPSATTGSPSRPDPEVTRYRLLLGENPVDPGQALRCYGACQERDTPESYLQCLTECPGFEHTSGVACAPADVPPRAACFTARPVPVGSEPQAGSVIIGVVANVALVVGVAAICASQTEPCAYSAGPVREGGQHMRRPWRWNAPCSRRIVGLARRTASHRTHQELR
jgi:hypothetical protein